MVSKRQVLFIADTISCFNLSTDSTYLCMLTCKDMGIEVFYCTQRDLLCTKDYNSNACTVKAHVTKLNIIHGTNNIYNPDWYSFCEQEVVDLRVFDCVLVRKDPPFDLEYYMMTQILSIAANYGVRIYNSPEVLRNYNEKMATLLFPDLIAPFIISKHKEELLQFIERNGDCIIKPINMMAGAGVIKTSSDDSNFLVLLEISSHNFTQAIMVQKFIPEVRKGDRRVFIINGTIIDYCLVRLPPANAVRSNIAVGGTGVVEPLDNVTREIATKVAQWAITIKGLNFIGLDIIGNYLNEINITSPTGLHQIYKHSGINGARIWLESSLS